MKNKNFKTTYFKKFKNKKQEKTKGKHFSMQCRKHISKDKMII
jgi:hypothetical protein